MTSSGSLLPTKADREEVPTLLPCPFCGEPGHMRDDSKAVYSVAPGGKRFDFAAGCREHCALSPWYETAPEAAAWWNRRAEPNARSYPESVVKEQGMTNADRMDAPSAVPAQEMDTRSQG